MTRVDLVEIVLKQMEGLNRRQSEVIVNGIFDSIRDALGAGEKVELRGFGSFKVRQRRSRDGRNPKTGEPVKVPPKTVPFFKPGKELRERVNHGEDTE
jgi:integration host factor subunit beta